MNAALALSLAIFFLLGVPIAVAIGLASVIGIEAHGRLPLLLVAQRMFTGLDSFPLMAIPLFILAGNFLNKAGITARLLTLATVIAGRMHGGLAQVSVVLSALMGGVSGSAIADASMQSRMLGEEMVRRGMRRGFAAGVLSFGALLTPVIPPGIGMILYGSIGQVSIGRLFAAEFRATDETWQAARLLDEAARTLNPIRRLIWAFTGRVNDARRLLARPFAGDPAALHGVAIAVHNLVVSFERMRALAAGPGGLARHTPAEAASICLAAPPRVLRYAAAPGANAHATFRAGTLVLFKLEAARARTLAHDVAFLSTTWSRCPAHAWVPALLETAWQRASGTARP